jgi:hypothetical protein
VPETLGQLLKPYGASPEEVIDLRREATPESVPYLDLLHGSNREATPDGVVEGHGEPLAYVLDRESRSTVGSLTFLKKTLTLRGDAPYLVILEPGRLSVYDTSWHEALEPVCLDTVSRNDDRARTTFQRLSLALLPEEGNRRYVHDLLFRLLNDAIDGLIDGGIGRDDAISLTGRSLFMRFLVDRRIVQAEDLPKICPRVESFQQIFSNLERAATTCSWLDETFNGDFLPLSFSPKGGFSRLASNALAPLENVMYRSPGGQLLLDWGDLDFAHVPIGLLSQVYERQAEAWDREGKRRESVFYTPFRIAEFMVKEVFAGLEESGTVPRYQARVLDPAAGGGVFLVSAFQEIVAAWWQHHGRPPDTREIRSILYHQISGFEISEPALRLAALSLYLKAIELDLNPRPPGKLQFDRLRGQVLHSVRSLNEEDGSTAGSLGSGVLAAHKGAYDVVIGNPPWTTLGTGGKNLHNQIVANLQPIAEERLGKERSAEFQIPDQLPDLPFVWRAMEWAKPGGTIAFALHGRLLFKDSKGGREAREALFQAISVTGILNGTDLRQTQVWPGIQHYFCLLFARNECPSPDQGFLFTSPYREEGLNRQGRLRIDSVAAHPVTLSRLREIPELLKALFRGTALDVSALEKIRFQEWPTVGQSFGDGRTGEGYKLNPPMQEAGFLFEQPNLSVDYKGPILIDPEELPRFLLPEVHRRRKESIFEGPLVIARKSMPNDRIRGRAFCCFSDVVYSESFYGYSTLGSRRPKALARYLILLLHSNLFLWYVLLTSSQFGVERDALYKEDVDDFPLRPLEDLPSSLKAEIKPLSDALFAGRCDWRQLDDWVARAYGLNRWDQEAIADTLATSLPYAPVRREAQRPPRDAEIKAFAARLQHELEPFAHASGHIVEVHRLDLPTQAPWEVLEVAISGYGSKATIFYSPEVLRELFVQADREGASQIFFLKPSERRLLIGIVRQMRYWTQSRARLCALEILGERLATLWG